MSFSAVPTVDADIFTKPALPKMPKRKDEELFVVRLSNRKEGRRKGGKRRERRRRRRRRHT
jgi:hypothetical protein